MPIDYSKFDRLVAASEEEDLRIEEARRKAEEDLERGRRGERKLKDIEKLRSAEEEWRCRSDLPVPIVKRADDRHARSNIDSDTTTRNEVATTVCRNGTAGSEDLSLKPIGQVVQSAAAGKDFESMTQEELANVDIDNFFRDLTVEEKEKKQRALERAKERQIQKEEDLGKRPLREKGLSPEEVVARIEHLEGDMKEMTALMERSDRPAVKARLGEFLVEIGNELARLRQDPLELDDEDRHELRLFQLRRYQLPGAARARQECAVDETTYAPKALDSAELDVCREQPWQQLTTYALELGDVDSPFVNIDVRVEAVERLPKAAVDCHFTEDSFDLQINHDLTCKRYRLRKTCLQYDIMPDQSTFSVKRNHVIVSLAKTPDAHNTANSDKRHHKYPPWSDLCALDKQSRNPTLERAD